MKLVPVVTGLRSTIVKKIISIEEKGSNIENKKLSIQISLSGLSFCVATSSNEILQTERVVFSSEVTPYALQKEIADLLEQNELGSQAFQEVVIIYNNNLFSIIPVPLFEENQKADYLKFNARIASNTEILLDRIEGENFVVVYGTNNTIHRYLTEQFPNLITRHGASLLIPGLLKKHMHSSGSNAYVHVIDKQLQLLIITDGKFRFFNSFDFSTKEDFIYYVLFTLEQLDLNPNTIQLQLFGDIEESDELYMMCYEYIKHVVIFYPEHSFSISDNLMPSSIDYFVLNSL